MGAGVECRDGPAAAAHGDGRDLRGIDYRLPVASAQVKSCVLFAGLLAEGETRVTEPAVTRDHTERMLAAAGARLESVDPRTTPAVGGGPARRITIEPADGLEPGRIEVPGDFSSAAFLVVAAAIVAGSAVRLEGVGLNPTRIGLLGILNRMGAAVEVEEDPARWPRAARGDRRPPQHARRDAGPPATRCRSRSTSCRWSPCSAASPRGGRWSPGPAELRHKESDRIATVVEGLRALGAEIEATEDGFEVRGTGGLRGGSARLARRSPPGDARRRRRPRLSRAASRSRAWARRRSATRRSQTDLAALGRPPSAGSGDPRRARARAGAAGGRPRWRGPRGARWGRTRPSSPAPPLAARTPSTSIAPGDHHQPGALVHLVLGEALAGGKLDHDRPPLGLGVEHLRLVRLHVELGDLPGSHRASESREPGQLYPQRHVDRHRRPGRAPASRPWRGRSPRASASPTSTPGRCTGASRWRRSRRGAPRRRGRARRLARGLEIVPDGGRVLLDGEDVTEAIRTPEVSAAASRVSVHPGVREAMVERQRGADRRAAATSPRAGTSAPWSARRRR